MSKIPPWVDWADVQGELSAKWKWGADLTREVRSVNCKIFVVGAVTPPPHDSVIIDGHRCPVQAARTKKPARPVQTLRLIRPGGDSSGKKVATPATKPMPTPKQWPVQPHGTPNKSPDGPLIEALAAMIAKSHDELKDTMFNMMQKVD